MICFFCIQPIDPLGAINWHHYDELKSEGGTKTAPAHASCHVAHHSTSGQFAEWGKRGGEITVTTKVWSLNLKNVAVHPAHEINRQFYRAHYAH